MRVVAPRFRPGLTRTHLCFVLAIFCFGLFGAQRSNATPLSLWNTAHELWSQVAKGAAEETIKAVQKSAGLQLADPQVSMDTFQVFVGRQHHLGLEVEGVSYELLLGNDEELLQQARREGQQHQQRAALPGTLGPALPAIAAGSSGVSGADSDSLPVPLLPEEHFADVRAAGPGSGLGGAGGQGRAASLALPAATLSGPLELVLSEPEQVSIFTPHAADVGGPVSRVLVEAGATVRLAGLRGVALRRPVDLPRLPGQYLAEVYAALKLGQPEEGFHFAPGILYMASQLRKRANSSSTPLLSLDVDTVLPGTLTITAAHEVAPGVPGSQGPGAGAGGPLPKLKVRRLAAGTIEISLRQGQLSTTDSADGGAGGFNAAALSHVWAWPLPHLDTSAWLPYEQVLRSVLAAHPFNLDKVVSNGIGLKLTKSTIQGVHLISFDMEVRAREEPPAELEGSGYAHNSSPLEVWEAVVQVQPKHAGGGPGGGYSFIPLHVKRKASYRNTLTLSRSAVLAALTGDNSTTPGEHNGYNRIDLGLEYVGVQGQGEGNGAEALP